mmetsp:Transcript_30732/g.89805  ORF Transcript_30732/g.89805 Transcript_30732/m.89805 type:complete len:296 (-) Transcript_30732:1711-2598(-)
MQYGRAMPERIRGNHKPLPTRGTHAHELPTNMLSTRPSSARAIRHESEQAEVGVDGLLQLAPASLLVLAQRAQRRHRRRRGEERLAVQPQQHVQNGLHQFKVAPRLQLPHQQREGEDEHPAGVVLPERADLKVERRRPQSEQVVGHGARRRRRLAAAGPFSSTAVATARPERQMRLGCQQKRAERRVCAETLLPHPPRARALRLWPVALFGLGRRRSRRREQLSRRGGHRGGGGGGVGGVDESALDAVKRGQEEGRERRLLWRLDRLVPLVDRVEVDERVHVRRGQPREGEEARV